AQTYSNWETLVIDNYSNDNTDNIVSGFSDPRIKLFKIHNNGIIAASRNLGIKQAQGEYIAFLDSDDWWTPQKLECSLKQLELGVDLVYHDMFIVARDKQKYFFRKSRVRFLQGNVFNDLIINGNPIMNSSVVVRKNVLQEVGGLCEDAELVAIEDYGAWLRISQCTNKFRRIPNILGYYWCGGKNTGTPERTIANLSVFEQRYSKDINNLCVGAAGPWWINYSRGRAYYLLGDYIKAKKSLEKVSYRKVPILVAIKALWLMLVIRYGYRPKDVV
ncbi:MAG TPA: glycosyl transferase family 2, partial [Coxiellaceae bacterium]|nr:glycosyl transferase family 2 [Coxiellaceae bacterium]